MNYIEEHPDYLKRFLYTSAADELIFNTIIHGREAELLVKPYMPLRYVSWTSNRFIADPRRPYTLNELDYDDFMDKNVFFCRKVDLPESEKLLDMIDNQRGKPFDCLNAQSLFPHLES